MCGIAGIINLNKQKVDFLEIKNITDLIAHRGPNGEGFFLKDNFALGHRRLSIIDLSESANQPMAFGGNQLVFNGEIFNYIEIRAELITLGYQFETSSDTEVILKAYDCWGEDCVKQFNGMWSLILYDSSKNTLFCSRDRFGIKPFYYLETEEKLIFSSEIKQLLPFLSKREANMEVVLDFLVLSLEEHNNETFFKGIYKLPPSNNLIFDLDNNKKTITPYYEYIPNEHNHKNEAEQIDEIKSLMEKAIDIRLRSDVKVGTCLSGGLDSSIIATVSSSQYTQGSNSKLYAVHAKSSEQKTDESSFAETVGNYANLDLVVIEPNTSDFLSNIRKVATIQEEPFGGPSVIFQYFVFEQAKKDNCPVMLDGQGGDEVLLGYERYYFHYMKTLNFFEKISFLNLISQQSRNSFLKNIVYYFYFNFPIIRRNYYKTKIPNLKKNLYKEVDFLKAEQKIGHGMNTKMLQKSELFQYQLPHLLKYEDKNSMYHSIESRLPFLDFDLVEVASNCSDRLKMKDGWSKYILRKAFENTLPKEIIWRKDKKGFEAPEDIWLKDRSHFTETIENSKFMAGLLDKGKISDSLDNKALWRLYSLALWAEIFNVE